MSFDPDSYLKGFNPDDYLKGFDPDSYLGKKPQTREEPFWDLSGERARRQFTGMGAQALAQAAQIGPALDYGKGVLMNLFGNTEAADRAFNRMKSQQATIEQWRKENTEGLQAPGRVAGTALGALSNLPEALTIGPARLTTGAIEEGATNTQALGIAAVQGATNLAGAVVPGGRAVQAAANVATGSAGDFATSRLAKIMGLDKTAKQFEEQATDPEALAVYGVTGAAFPPNIKPKKPNVDPVNRLKDNIKSQGTPPEQIPGKETPTQLAEYAIRAHEMARKARETPINVDSSGVAGIDPNSMKAMADIESQPIVGKQFGGIDPEANRQAAMRDISAKQMSLLDESQYPVNDGGVRPIGTDGTPLRGMAEDVPTIDFPLRQEVLDSPEIKQAIDNFRIEAERLQREGNQEALDQLTRDFTAGMQRLGIARPEDAFGRALYEGGDQARYLETGIRRGGERNTSLTYGLQKQLPFGGKKPTELIPISQKRGTFVPKGQRGMINPSVFKEGFEKLKDLGDGFKLRAFSVDNLDRYSPYNSLKVEILKDDNKVGSATFFIKNPYVENKSQLRVEGDGPFVKPEYRNKGLAKAMYEFVSELGNDVEASSIQTHFGKGLWEGLNRSGIAQGKMIPARQRGGAKGTWNPGKVREAVSKTFDDTFKSLSDLKFPESLEELRQRAVNRVPGLRDVNFIRQDEPLTPEVKQQILSEKDGGSWWAFSPGRVGKQELSGSTLIKTAGRYWENARNRYLAFSHNEVSPLKAEMAKLFRNNEHVEHLHEIVKMAIERRSHFTMEELVNAGFNERVIRTYELLTSTLEKIGIKENETLLEKGQKPFKMLDAYMSARWRGPWKATVKDETGKIVYYIAERTALGRKRAMDYIKMHEPNLKIDEIKYDKNIASNKDMLMAGYKEMIDLLGKDDPTVNRLSELMKQLATSQTENVKGQEKHFLSKSGKKGYAGASPWWGIKDTKDLFKAQLDYIENGALWSEQQKAAELTKQLISDPDIMKAQPNNIGYVRELSKMEMGTDAYEWVRGAEHAVANLTKLSPGHFTQAVSTMKAIFYLKTLGFNLPFAAISLAQPLVVMPAGLLSKGAANPSAVFAAMSSGPALAIRLITKDVGIDPSMKKLGVLDEEAFEFAKANRVAELNQLTDVRDVESPRLLNIAEKTAGVTISVPELAARSVTFMSFVHGMKHKYDVSTKEGRLKLYQDAAEMVKFTMGDYAPEQKAPIYQRLGVMGNAASTLQTFVINMMMQHWQYSKMAAKGNPAPLMALLGMEWVFAGMTGMLALDDLDNLLSWAKQYLSHDLYMKVKDFSIKQAMIENMGTKVSYGLVSEKTGTNLYNRFSVSDVLQAPPFETDLGSVTQSYLPFVVDFGKNLAAMKTLVTDSTEYEKVSAGYQLTPSGLRGIYEEGFGPIPPMLRKGDIIRQPSAPKRAQVRRPESEKGLRQAGFKSFKEQKTLDETYAQRVQEKINDTRREKVRSDFNDEFIAGNQEGVIKQIKRFMDLDGHPKDLFSGKQAILEAYIPLIEREILKMQNSKNPAQIKKSVKYLEILNRND